MPDAYCKPCRDRGRMETATRLVGRKMVPMCDACWLASEKKEVKEEKPMSKRQCSKCGKDLRSHNRSGVCTACQKETGGGHSQKERPAERPAIEAAA